MSLIDKKSYKKQKKDTLKKKLLSSISKIKKLQKKSQEIVIKTCQKNKKDKIKEYQKKRYQELIQYKKEALKNRSKSLSVYNIIMGEKLIKFKKRIS